MPIDRRVAFDTMSEADLAPILELLQGRDPGEVARQAGTRAAHLLNVRDDLLAQVERQRAGTMDRPPKKVGRNAPCPCGSGKKYKHCCLNRRPPAGKAGDSRGRAAADTRQAEQQKLIRDIEAAFALLGAGQVTAALKRTSRLIACYPNEDRLHDILATGYVHLKSFDKAIEICRRRLTVAEIEKAYFIETGRYRDATIDRPALSYYYPPMTWRQKYWTALKARDYHARYPREADPAVVRLIRTLQTADDEKRFPQKHARGLDLRRAALQDSLAALQRSGPAVIPYVLPLSVKYGWSGLFVPEILAAHATPLATRSLIDISMFGFAYASGACLHYLEKRGPSVLPHIEAAFARDTVFDPLKTGIIAVLGNLQTPAAYRLLLGFLEHESAHIVNWAGAALAKFQKIEALPQIVAASARIGGQRMIEAAIRHLKDLENGA